MPLEHLHFLAVFKADDVFLRDGFYDCHRGLRTERRFLWCILDRNKRTVNIPNQCRQSRNRNRIMGGMCRYNLRGKGEDVVFLL